MEHQERAMAVIHTVQTKMGVASDNVLAFVSNGASVFRAAYENILQIIFGPDKYICFILNNDAGFFCTLQVSIINNSRDCMWCCQIWIRP